MTDCSSDERSVRSVSFGTPAVLDYDAILMFGGAPYEIICQQCGGDPRRNGCRVCGLSGTLTAIGEVCVPASKGNDWHTLALLPPPVSDALISAGKGKKGKAGSGKGKKGKAGSGKSKKGKGDSKRKGKGKDKGKSKGAKVKVIAKGKTCMGNNTGSTLGLGKGKALAMKQKRMAKALAKPSRR